MARSNLQSTRYHLQTLLKSRGPFGLYRGFMVSNFTSLPAYGVYMGCYTWTKDNLTSHSSLSSLYGPFIAGFVADAASIALYVPGDVVVQRLQIHNSPYTGFFDACNKIAREEGLKGFYRGFGATFLTSGVASAVWWLIYENVKERLYEGQSNEQLERERNASKKSLWSALVEVNRLPQLGAGYVAGSLTSALINPLDVVKTRLQVQDAFQVTYSPLSATQPQSIISKPSLEAANACAVTPRRYRNVFHGLYRLYADEGMKGMFRGVMPKLLSRGPLSALSSLLYEMTLFLSRKQND
jgi:solute carrier family 25 iron transporter 28/37